MKDMDLRDTTELANDEKAAKQNREDLAEIVKQQQENDRKTKEEDEKKETKREEHRENWHAKRDIERKEERKVVMMDWETLINQ